VSKKLQITLVQNQSFSESFQAEGPPTIYTIQPPFMLTEAHFHVLKSDVGGLSSILQNLVASLIVLAVTIVIRWVYGIAKQQSSGLGWIDLFTTGGLTLVILSLFLASRCWPAGRSKLVRDIQGHFDKNQPLFGSGKTHGRSR